MIRTEVLSHVWQQPAHSRHHDLHHLWELNK